MSSQQEENPNGKGENPPWVLGCYIAVLVGIFLGLLYVLWPVSSASREASPSMSCSNLIKNIALGLHNYMDVYGTFPPAYTVDADGNPIHSWRVLILPFIENENLYRQIRLDEPWDSEYNRQFHTQMPSIYVCPVAAANAKRNGLTSYLWIIGPDTISDGPDARPGSDFTRGFSNSIAVVEVVPSVNWMAPDDIPVADIDKVFGSPHKNGVSVAFADGSVRFITAPKKIRDNANIREAGRKDEGE